MCKVFESVQQSIIKVLCEVEAISLCFSYDFIELKVNTCELAILPNSQVCYYIKLVSGVLMNELFIMRERSYPNLRTF